ncbi:hypothetical protein TCAL_12815 [Tigriopus californicus]|uniref:Uncharacterized protein n=1 Tax=Tigriopus californicus TaxID=6832 RepID=A0A553NXP2_TIGCA|nr:uncharacterized protein LOC131887423 [Tigriopus californicus]TRY70205.1 hypothetical protein TCAL_12815 [Tigriopus californicus]
MNTLLVLSVSIAITNGLGTYRNGPGIGNLFDLVGVTPGPEPESTTLGLWQETNQDQPGIEEAPFKEYQEEADKFMEKFGLPFQRPLNDKAHFDIILNSIIDHILINLHKKKKRDGVNKEDYPNHHPLEDGDGTGDSAAEVHPKLERGTHEFQRLMYKALQSLDPEEALAVADKLGLAEPKQRTLLPHHVPNLDHPKNFFGNITYPVPRTWNRKVNLSEFHLKAENLTLYLCPPPGAMIREDHQNVPWKAFNDVMDYFRHVTNFWELRICNKDSVPATMNDIKYYIKFSGRVEHVNPHYGSD